MSLSPQYAASNKGHNPLDIHFRRERQRPPTTLHRSSASPKRPRGKFGLMEHDSGHIHRNVYYGMFQLFSSQCIENHMTVLAEEEKGGNTEFARGLILNHICRRGREGRNWRSWKKLLTSHPQGKTQEITRHAMVGPRRTYIRVIVVWVVVINDDCSRSGPLRLYTFGQERTASTFYHGYVTCEWKKKWIDYLRCKPPTIAVSEPLPSISSLFTTAAQASWGSVGTKYALDRLKFNGLPKSFAGRILYEYAISSG